MFDIIIYYRNIASLHDKKNEYCSMCVCCKQLNRMSSIHRQTHQRKKNWFRSRRVELIFVPMCSSHIFKCKLVSTQTAFTLNRNLCQHWNYFPFIANVFIRHNFLNDKIIMLAYHTPEGFIFENVKTEYEKNVEKQKWNILAWNEPFGSQSKESEVWTWMSVFFRFDSKSFDGFSHLICLPHRLKANIKYCFLSIKSHLNEVCEAISHECVEHVSNEF